MLISYEVVSPLVSSTSLLDATLVVTFRCPVNDKEIKSMASVGDESSEWYLRTGVAGAVRHACGIAGKKSEATIPKLELSEKQRSAGIVDAFASVQDQFVWDKAGNRFISAEAAGQVLTPFNQQLATGQVTSSHDQDVLARMLVEIACADGDLGEDERAFLRSFLPHNPLNPSNLIAQAQMSPLRSEELAKCSAGPSRDTMLMLAWALAFSDEKIAPEEATLLAKLAGGLEISHSRSQQLKIYAQIYVVDNALGRAYAGGQRDEQQHAWVMELAQRIGLATVEAQGADIRFRRRYGLS